MALYCFYLPRGELGVMHAYVCNLCSYHKHGQQGTLGIEHAMLILQLDNNRYHVYVGNGVSIKILLVPTRIYSQNAWPISKTWYIHCTYSAKFYSSL